MNFFETRENYVSTHRWATTKHPTTATEKALQWIALEFQFVTKKLNAEWVYTEKERNRHHWGAWILDFPHGRKNVPLILRTMFADPGDLRLIVYQVSAVKWEVVLQYGLFYQKFVGIIVCPNEDTAELRLLNIKSQKVEKVFKATNDWFTREYEFTKEELDAVDLRKPLILPHPEMG